VNKPINNDPMEINRTNQEARRQLTIKRNKTLRQEQTHVCFHIHRWQFATTTSSVALAPYFKRIGILPVAPAKVASVSLLRICLFWVSLLWGPLRIVLGSTIILLSRRSIWLLILLRLLVLRCRQCWCLVMLCCVLLL